MGNPVIIMVVVGLVVLETALSGCWTPWYFRGGITIFTRRLPLRSTVSSRVLCDALSDAFPRSWMPRQVFRELSNSEIAFREKAFEITLLHYTPIMHGLISLVPMERTVLVRGFLNWFTIGLGAYVILVASVEPFFEFSGLFLGVFVIVVLVCYTIQARAYEKICEVLRQQLSAM